MTVRPGPPRRMDRLEAEVARLRDREVALQARLGALEIVAQSLQGQVGRDFAALLAHVADDSRHTGKAK